MITEDYVSFETAKLLKEKGFDGNCYKVWAKESKSEPELYAAPNFVEGETTASRESVEDAERFMNGLNLPEYKIEGYLAPTIQMARKWLRETHSLDIYPHHDYTDGDEKWWFEIIRFPSSYAEYESDSIYLKYEDACEAAIKYCLEILI